MTGLDKIEESPENPQNSGQGINSVERKPKKRHLGVIGLAALVLIGLGSYVYLTDRAYRKSQESSAYNELVRHGITQENAKILAPKINSELTSNQKKFIEIVSKYPPELQKICVTSDILDNNHISKAEIEATKRATLEGIVNPSEIYAVLANAPGDIVSDEYSQKNTESSLEGLLSFYRLLRTKGIDDENIQLLVYNRSGIPIKRDEIKIDGESTNDNFTKALKRINSDKTDTLYVVISSPNPLPKKSVSSARPNFNYIKFDGGLVSNNNLLYELCGKGINKDNFKYGKAIIIGQTYGAKSMLSCIQRNTSLWDNKPFSYLRNVLTIASPNDLSPNNETFLKDLTRINSENPRLSIKETIELINQKCLRSGKAEAFYYNKVGENRSPMESDFYDQPLPF